MERIRGGKWKGPGGGGEWVRGRQKSKGNSELDEATRKRKSRRRRWTRGMRQGTKGRKETTRVRMNSQRTRATA